MSFKTYVDLLIKNGNTLNSPTAPIYNGSHLTMLTNGFPSNYNGLEVKVGFGKGHWASIPWIGFFGGGQKPTYGIYPVLLYYRQNNILILAYGISATKKPSISWALTSPMTIGDYFKSVRVNAKNSYHKSYVYKVYDASKIPASIDTDIDALIAEYKTLLASIPTSSAPAASSKKTTASVSASSDSTKFSVGAVVSTIGASGLKYTDQFISRFVISLMTKPFVILSGLAGSGKTQLAIAFAKAMSDNLDKQIRVVPVGADWTNREPLLGYPNAIKAGEYVHPDSDVLQLLLDANADPTHPYFLILDEMNLSYVERYFADFLSAIESKSSILLWKDKSKAKKGNSVPETVLLPSNLFIIGTINVDETTYMFSPKVLDRANVIEFKIDDKDLEEYMDNASVIDINSIEKTLSPSAQDFVVLSKTAISTDFTKSKGTLLDFFKELKSVNAEFGYRSTSEIGRFIELADKYGGMNIDESIDAAIVQKLLPKLHGSLNKLKPVLTALWKKCVPGVDLKNDSTVPATAKYKLSADKLLRMYKSALDNGFTSFTEA